MTETKETKRTFECNTPGCPKKLATNLDVNDDWLANQGWIALCELGSGDDSKHFCKDHNPLFDQELFDRMKEDIKALEQIDMVKLETKIEEMREKSLEITTELIELGREIRIEDKKPEEVKEMEAQLKALEESRVKLVADMEEKEDFRKKAKARQAETNSEEE